MLPQVVTRVQICQGGRALRLRGNSDGGSDSRKTDKHWFRRNVRPEDGDGKVLRSLVCCRTSCVPSNITTCTEHIKCLNNTEWHMIAHLHSDLNSGDQIETNEMSCACSTYDGDERCVQGFGLET